MPDPQIDVEKVARLARIALTDDEKARFGVQLVSVLAYVAQLDALDLDGVPPTTSAVPSQNVWRDDVVEPSLSREDALYNAAEASNGQFKIQAVFTADA